MDEVMIDSKMPAYVKTLYKGNKIMMQLFGIIGIQKNIISISSSWKIEIYAI